MSEKMIFLEVGPGKVYRISKPESPADFTDLKERGIKTILSLESGLFDFLRGVTNRETRISRECGITQIQYKLAPIFCPSYEEIRDILYILSDQSLWPIAIHCKDSVDRTGVACAAYRVRVQKWSPEKAVKEMLDLGFHEIRYFYWLSQIKKRLT